MEPLFQQVSVLPEALDLAATIPEDRVEDAARALDGVGVDYGDIGLVTEGAGAVVLRDGEASCYNEVRAEEDELARMWAIHRPSG